jgi:hypothetical protein
MVNKGSVGAERYDADKEVDGAERMHGASH